MTPDRRRREDEALRTPASGSRPAPPQAAFFPQGAIHAILLAAYTAVYLSITVPIASKRLLWNDELFTLTLAGRPFHEMWQLLLNGADQVPLAFCAITDVVLPFGGPRELLIRAPEICGFWLMGICLFEFTAFRTSLWHGAMAAFLPCLTTASLYSFEARPYGLVLGFTALALVLWQRASSERRLRWARLGFGLALMGAVSVHYYAVFVIVPFAAAEAFRSWRQRSLRPSAWLPMGAALVPILIAAPLIANAGKVAHGFWARASWRWIPQAYVELLGPHFLAGLAVAALTGSCTIFLLRPFEDKGGRLWSTPVHEVICVLSLVTLPVLVVPIAKMTTGAFVGRYVIVTVIGVCILITWGIYLFAPRRLAITGLLLAAVLLSTVWSGRMKYLTFTVERQEKLALADKLGDIAPASLPVVVEGPQLFFQLFHYAPARLTRRMIYLADVSRARGYTGTDTVDFGMIAMGVAAGARVSEFETFRKSTPRFLVYGYPSPPDFGWLVHELVSRHTGMQIVGELDDRLLLLVEDGGSEDLVQIERGH